MKRSGPIYRDLGNLAEDERIRTIGEAVAKHMKKSAFIVDNEEKADRYVAKLTERYPGIRIIARGHGPVANSVWVKVGPPLQ